MPLTTRAHGSLRGALAVGDAAQAALQIPADPLVGGSVQGRRINPAQPLSIEIIIRTPYVLFPLTLPSPPMGARPVRSLCDRTLRGRPQSGRPGRGLRRVGEAEPSLTRSWVRGMAAQPALIVRQVNDAISARICAKASRHSASIVALPATIRHIPSVVTSTGSQVRRSPSA